MGHQVRMLAGWGDLNIGDIAEVDEENYKALKQVGGMVEDYDATTDAAKQQEKANEQKSISDMVAKACEAEISKGIQNAMAEMEAKNPGMHINFSIDGKAPQEKKFKSLGENLLGVCAGSATKAPTGQSEQVNADGGFLVEPDFATFLITRLIETGKLFGRTNCVPVSGNGIKFNGRIDYDRTDGNHAVNVFRIAEAATKTASKATFERIQIDLEKLVGLWYSTDELLADATALSAMASDWFLGEFGYKIDFEIMRGTGTAEMLGLLDAGNAARVDVVRDTGGTVSTQDIVNMYSRMFSGSLANAQWDINSETFPAITTMQIGNQPIFMPPGGLPNAPAGTLLGRPINIIEQAGALNALGDVQFNDLSQYLVIEKGGVDADSSIHVRFVEDETVFRWVLRNNGKPTWTTVLTPNQGSATQSPFVALAAGV